MSIYEYRSLEFPLVISIKRKYSNKKNISEDNFKILIKMIRNVLVNYLEYSDYNLLDCNSDLLNCIVMETQKNYNIVFPYFITNYQIQKYIKDNIVEQEKNINKIRSILNIYQETIFNIFDDNVYDISRYKWLMYGCDSNRLIYRFDSNCNKIDCSKFDIYQLIVLTSMRIKSNNTDNLNISKIIKTNQDSIVLKNKDNKAKLTTEMRNKLKIYKNNEYKSHTYFPDKNKGESGDVYYVADENLEDFYDIIYNYLSKNVEVHVVERRNNIHPIIIDLDIRQLKNERLYTSNTILGDRKSVV